MHNLHWTLQDTNNEVLRYVYISTQFGNQFYIETSILRNSNTQSPAKLHIILVSTIAWFAAYHFTNDESQQVIQSSRT